MHDEKGSAENKPVLIIPAAGKSSRFPNMKPKWMLTHPSGELMIEKVVAGLDLSCYKKVYIVVLEEHCSKYEADIILNQAFVGDKYEVVVLKDATSSSPETVYQCVKNKNIDAFIVVKDCDCLVSYNHPTHERFVVGLDVRKNHHVNNLHQKSFIVSDANGVVQEIIEKSIVSNQICLGVYAMHSSDLIRSYERLSVGMGRELYFSHIVSDLIDSGMVFSCTDAIAYTDWGTKEEWFSSSNLKQTYFIDIDGVLLVNTGKYGSKNWFNTIEPISDNVDVVRQLSADGHEIVFVTSRTEDALLLVREFLSRENINYKTIVSSCFHSRRTIVNDFASTNPFPSCMAINVPRNDSIKPYIDGRKD
jgi:hypothetical protein